MKLYNISTNNIFYYKIILNYVKTADNYIVTAVDLLLLSLSFLHSKDK